jgi:glycosyltransferase involved in cell wall biosynthesis
MNVIHVIDSLDPRLGGPAICAPSLAAAQSALGHSVTVFCYGNDAGTKDIEERNSLIPGFGDVHLVEVPVGDFVETLFAIRASKMLDALFRVNDIVHIHGIWRPLMLSACGLALRHNKKYIITPHGMLDPWSLRQHPIKKKAALMLGWRFAFNHCHFMHALNPIEKEKIKPLNIRCPIRIFPNGVFSNFVTNNQHEEKKFSKFDALNDRPFILYLGRLHYKKGLDYLASAFRLFCEKNSSVDLVVAGPDGGALLDFQNRISKSGIGLRVHVIGSIYGAVKKYALVNALCLCLPSRQEGFSMAVIESLACSTPVVISKQCNFPEVQEASVGYVVPLEPEKIAKALLQIANNQRQSRAMGKAASAWVRDNFLWEKIAASIQSAYVA